MRQVMVLVSAARAVGTALGRAWAIGRGWWTARVTGRRRHRDPVEAGAIRRLYVFGVLDREAFERRLKRLKAGRAPWHAR